MFERETLALAYGETGIRKENARAEIVSGGRRDGQFDGRTLQEVLKATISHGFATKRKGKTLDRAAK